jgi:hypothetical protein
MAAAEGRDREAMAQKLAFRRAEDRMAPVEYMDWAKGQGAHDPFGTRADLSGQSDLQPFVGQDLGPGGTIYRGPRPARGLIIVFCSKAHRMGLPTPALLQRISAGDWDVLMLRDLAQSHFRHGCEGLARGFPALVGYLRHMAKGYGRVVLFGASLGAAASVRMAIAMGGVPVVAFGARPALDIDRMYRDREPGFAFDPLCACLPVGDRDISYVYGADFRPDRRAARMFQAVTGGYLRPVPRLAEHGVPGPMWRAGLLGAFMETALSEAITPAMRQRKLGEILARVVPEPD